MVQIWGLVQSGRGARLALEAFQSLVVLGKMFRQKLQGDEPTELGVLGLINHTHPRLHPASREYGNEKRFGLP